MGLRTVRMLFDSYNMKTVVILFVCALVTCLFIEAKADCPARDNSGKIVPTGTEVKEGCAIYKCNDNGGWSSSGCALWQCQETVGYKEQNNSLPFPDCCPGPICKKSK